MTDIVKTYLDARTKLQHEKTAMESRLREINKVLQADGKPAATVSLVPRARPAAAPASKPRKRKMSAAARAAISAAAKARWAKRKAAGKNKL